MEVNYIIIQAGGKGTRLKHLTQNKPKALVPIDNLPMIFHCFKTFKDKKFIIIGDYKCDVLKKYLSVFSEVPYIVVDAQGKNGTCAGLQKALDMIPPQVGFLLMWSDLVLPNDFLLQVEQGNYIGISKDFECRWSYENKYFVEKPSAEYGVAGFFIFQRKDELENVPEEGEFVRWLQTEKKMFDEIPLYKTKEYGLLSEYQKIGMTRCRPFNRIVIDGDKIIKEGIDKQGLELAVKEKKWYMHVMNKNFPHIPYVYSFEPFIMQRINGRNVFEYELNYESKLNLLKKIILMLKKLHSIEQASVDYFSIWENYYFKTFERLERIQNMVPFAHDEYILINGKKCRNIFFYKNLLDDFMQQYRVNKFVLLHGDCTFSNILLDEKLSPVLIDPRGYFGYSFLVGDANYDWAKLYYSIIGDYDQFNLKKFLLNIDETQHKIDLQIQSNNWKDLEKDFFKLLDNDVSKKDIKMLHAVIWLSLTTYAWEDYDSICGAFYNGLLYFEEALNELS